jgi:hypothetical protein
MEIKINASSEILNDYYTFINKKGHKFEIKPLFKERIGISHEPLLIALIVSLGGPVVIKEFIGLLKHYMRLKHIEKMKDKEMIFEFINPKNTLKQKYIKFDEIIKILESNEKYTNKSK